MMYQKKKSSNQKKASDKELLDSYSEIGNIWKVAEKFGMCGQSVHERLQKLGVKMGNPLTDEERQKIRELYSDGFRRGDGKLDQLINEIGRNKQVISREARRQGLSNPNRILSDSRVSQMVSAVKISHKKNGHPRGFKGYKHKPESLAIISEKSKAFSDSLTEAQRSEITMKQLKTREERYGTLAPQRHKVSWKGGWREIGEKRNYYRSRWEANYARYLQFLFEQGDIKEWEHEPETFWFEDIKRGTRSYLPDFRVVNAVGEITYHEVKGWMDDRSKTKLKRMKKYHPEVKIVLIQKKEYEEIKKKLGALLPGWE